MADTAQKENIMGTQKMSKLILYTGIPLMISLFINSLYNFVDSMFVSQVSEKALTALSLAAPAQLLVSALGLGNAVGLNAVISKALGRKDCRVRCSVPYGMYVVFSGADGAVGI